MGRTGRSAQKAADKLRELEKLVRIERRLPTVDYEVLLREGFRELRVGQLVERFPALSVALPVERNRWVSGAELRLRERTALLIARGATGASGLVSGREFFLMAATALSSHGFRLSRLDEGRLVLIRNVPGNERIGKLVQALKGRLDGLLVKAEKLERSRKERFAKLVAAIRALDGSRLGASPTPSLAVKMLLSSVYPELAAFLLLIVRPRYEKAVYDAVLREMGFDEKGTSMVLHDAWTFGLVGASGDSVSLAHLGRFLSDLLHRIVEGGIRVQASRVQTWRYRIHNVMNYVILKFPRKLSKISQRMRENPEALEKVSRIVAENVTFTDVLACVYVYLGLEMPEWLRAETLEKLANLGMLSKNGRLRPFGKALAMCFIDYLKDSGIVDEESMPTLAEWARMLWLS